MKSFALYNSPVCEDCSEAIRFHLENDIPFLENIFRMGSEGFFEFFIEAKVLYRMGKLRRLNDSDIEILNTDIGDFAQFEGQEVPLDIPMTEEDAKVELNKPKRGGSKKYYVYVKSDKGNVIKIQFGDDTGLSAKINDPAARKSFVARHKCSEKTDKTKAGYWACRLPKYAKALGLSGGGNYFW
jgi:hypothetical protein